MGTLDAEGNISNTPAYAGKRTLGAAKDSVGWKHPRIRGKSYDGFLCGFSLKHPRIRGKGKWCTPIADRKHPRIRGEKNPARTIAFFQRVTPPHTRGKLGCSVGTVHRETPPHTRGNPHSVTTITTISHMYATCKQ